MNKSDLKRLMKIEERIGQIAAEDLKLNFCPIEFDIIPPQKMLEISAYNIPTNISNWKRGRDYERQRTIYEHSTGGLPYEVVIHSDPARAYLMNNNMFSVQCLVIAHVYGHCAFFTSNKFFQKSRRDMIAIMYEATKRFNRYERRYGIDEVEKTVDAGHALQMHSNPFDSTLTEQERRLEIFEREKKAMFSKNKGKFSDISTNSELITEDVELAYQKLWRKLSLKTPVEPTSDLIAYIIDNSPILQDWQKDILETLRLEGQYYWPIMKTKFMNEGFAVQVHEKIMNQLFEEGLLKSSEHADYNYANSLVKNKSMFNLNPYSIGFGVWKSVEERWNKGQHGQEWENCTDSKEKENWDTGDMKGWGKILETMRTYTDWFFMYEFLTPEVIKDLELYIYKREEKPQSIDYVITKDEAEDIRRKILRFFSYNMIPDIQVINGNYEEKGWFFWNRLFFVFPY